MTSPQHVRLYPTPPRKPRISGDAPDGEMGAPYNFGYTVWGLGNLTTTVVSGSLPPGLTLGANGVLSGIPTLPGFYSWRARVTQGNLLYAEVDDTSDIEAALWIAGPVAENDAAGGSQNFYKKTQDINDWSAPPVPLPLGRTGLLGISVANQRAFMMFSGGQNAVSSIDGANFWDSCNVSLPDKPVYWNGSRYVCGTYISSNGIIWSTIPNLTGTPSYTVARPYDGAIILAYNDAPEPRFEYTLDNGATWTVVPASPAHDEPIYSLIAMPDGPRINFGVGSPSTANIAQYFTDDLFVTNVTAGSNRYHGKYGCGRMLVKGYPDTLEFTADGGWGWSTRFGSNITNHQFNFLDFGQNIWAVLHRSLNVSPQQHQVRYSTDGGNDWSTGPTLYGSVNSIAYIGRVGNCSIYPPPAYTLFTNYHIFGGTPDTVIHTASRQWGNAVIRVSRDGQFAMNASTTSNAIVSIHRRVSSGLGFEVIPNEDAFSSYRGAGGDLDMSYDSQYFCIRRSGTSTFAVLRYNNGVFYELTVPGTPNVSGKPFFHPNRNIMFWESGTGIQAYSLSGDTITEGSFTLTGAWYVSDIAFSPTDPDIMIVRTNVGHLQIYDISNISVTLPRLVSFSAGSSSGEKGLYFSADGTGVITVDLYGIYHRAWNKTSATLDNVTQLYTPVNRMVSSSLTKDGLYLATAGDVNAADYLNVHRLTPDGASILSTTPPLNYTGAGNNYVTWVDF